MSSVIKLLVVCTIVAGAGATLLTVDWPLRPALEPAAAERAASARQPRWVAAAPGRIEPQSGEFRVGSSTVGRIAEVLVHPGDRVVVGDLLIRLDDSEVVARVATAAAEVTASEHERDRESQNDGSRRREAEDTVWEAEQRLSATRNALDRAVAGWRTGAVNADEVAKARASVAAASDELTGDRDVLAAIKSDPNTPPPTAPDLALAVARAQLSVTEAALEHTRVRAPVGGTVLQVSAKPGETAAPVVDAALVIIGDLTGLRVRAEVHQRDLAKVKVGQRVMIRADAFQDVTFDGKVTSVAPSLAPAQLNSRDLRRANDADVLEAFAMVDGATPLVTGLRVDVLFLADESAVAGGQSVAR